MKQPGSATFLTIIGVLSIILFPILLFVAVGQRNFALAFLGFGCLVEGAVFLAVARIVSDLSAIRWKLVDEDSEDEDSPSTTTSLHGPQLG
jgi:hypothetical protein